MSGILFLLTVAAFVVVVHWAYSNEPLPNAGATGLLAMTEGGHGEPASLAPRPATWKQSRRPQYGEPFERAEAPRASGSGPRWWQDPRRARRPH
jgi:hypothetical protein